MMDFCKRLINFCASQCGLRYTGGRVASLTLISLISIADPSHCLTFASSYRRMKFARTFALWLTTCLTVIFWTALVKAAPPATAEQIRSCTNAVVLELEGVPRSEVVITADALQPNGAGRISWETRDGRSGACWMNAANQSVQIEIENAQITNPVVFENDATAVPGAAMIVSTDGGDLNVRRSPAGEVMGMVADGSTVILTGQTNGEWVEIEGGRWVSRYHLIHNKPPVSSSNSSSETISEESRDERPDNVALQGSGPAGTAIVRSGSGINIRRSPDGEIFGSVADGTTVILTGETNGEWVEIEGGGWVFEAYLQRQSGQ